LPFPVLPLALVPVRWSWRPHSRRRRCRRRRSLRCFPHAHVVLCSFVKYLRRWPVRGRQRSSRSIFRRSAQSTGLGGRIPAAAASSEPPADSSVSTSGSRRICETKQQEHIGAKECRDHLFIGYMKGFANNADFDFLNTKKTRTIYRGSSLPYSLRNALKALYRGI